MVFAGDVRADGAHQSSYVVYETVREALPPWEVQPGGQKQVMGHALHLGVTEAVLHTRVHVHV